MSAKKNPERDLTSAQRLHAWMAEHGHTDRMVAEKTKMSASTVKTWRRGVRPNAVAREALKELVGWDWDNPPGTRKKATKGEVVAEIESADVPVDTTTLAGGSVVTLLAARARLKACIKRQKFDLSDKDDLYALNVALESVEETLVLREQSDAAAAKVTSLCTRVANSNDPDAVFALIALYEEPAVVDAIRYALDIGSVRTGKRKLAS